MEQHETVTPFSNPVKIFSVKNMSTTAHRSAKELVLFLKVRYFGNICVNTHLKLWWSSEENAQEEKNI